MLDHLTRSKALLFVLLLMLAVLGRNAFEQAPKLIAADLPNPDSYYKLVMVRDHDPAMGFNFVARDNAPYGVWMHWSLPHTWTVWVMHKGLMALGLEQQPALLVAGGGLTLLSMLLLALLVALAVANAGSPKAAVVAALAVASSPPLFGYGQLLQITHHIFMLVPVAAAAACFLRPAFGAGRLADFAGGLLLGLALWISPETMPLVVALAGLRAAIRLQYPQSGAVWPVAVGLMLMLCAGLWLDPPPPTFSAWALDHISHAWLLLGALLAALLLYTDACVRRSLSLPRSAGELALALLLAAVIWGGMVPGALQGAGSLIPAYLHEVWYLHINELQPVGKPSEWLAYLLLPVASGMLLLVMTWRERSLWLLVLAVSVLAYAGLAAGHIRMGAASALLAALAFGLGLSRVHAFEHMHEKSLPMRAQLFVVALILLVPLQVLGAAGLAQLENDHEKQEADENSCRFDTMLPLLTTLPPGVVLTETNLGPEVLFKTRHQVVAGNYHHNIAGLTDSFHMLRSLAPDAEARVLADRRGVDQVVMCTDVGSNLKRGKSERTLAQRVAASEPVDWLPRQEAVEDWRMYGR